MCAGTSVSRLGCHARGEICGVLGRSQLPFRTSCAHECMLCGVCNSYGMPHIYPLCGILGDSQLPQHEWQDGVILSRMHVASILRGARETWDKIAALEKTLWQKKSQKPIRRCSAEHRYSVFCVFRPILHFVKRFWSWGHQADRKKTDARFLGRQSEEALLAKQGKPSSNLTKLGYSA